MQPPKSLLHLVVNPTAGRGMAAKALPAIQACLKSHGCDVITTQTSERGQAETIAKQAILDGSRVIVAVGGDGTLHEVSNAVIDADPKLNATLGLIPCGTGNDFARCVGLVGNIEQICAVLVEGKRRYVDVGTVECDSLPVRRFLVAAGVGYIADTAATVNAGIRYLRGMPAYILGAIQTLSQFHPRLLKLRIDGQPERTVETMLVSVSNVETTGGGMLIAPGALFDDGMLNICLVRKISKLELLKQLPNVIKGTHVRHPAVEMILASAIEIASDIPLPLWIDGEVTGSTPAKFRVEAGKLPMLLPAI